MSAASPLLSRVLATTAALILAPAAWAGVLADDDFTGNSGGIPTGWTEYSFLGATSGGTVVETGTVVQIDDPAGGIPFYLTPGSYNPQGETSTFTMEIDSIGTGGEALIAFSEASITHFMALRLNETGVLDLLTSNAGPGAATLVTNLGTIAGYSGGAADVSIVFDDIGFTVTEDLTAFSATNSWAALPFNFAAVGTSVDLVFGAQDGLVAFDRAFFSVTGDQVGGGGANEQVPAPAAWLLLLVAGAGLLRRRGPTPSSR